MVIIPKERKFIGNIKQNVKNFHICPFCKKKVEIGIEINDLNQLNKEEYFPYPHLHLHGNPLHGMLFYIDKNLDIRSIAVIKSIEISRDSETFSQAIKKWCNPFWIEVILIYQLLITIILGMI